MLIKKYYQEIIFVLLIFIMALAAGLGWSSKETWAGMLLAGLIFITLIFHLTFDLRTETAKFSVLLIFFFLFLAISTFTSVYKYNTLVELVKFASYLAAFWLAGQYFNSSTKLKIFCFGLIALGAVISTYALTQFKALQFLETGLAANFVWKNSLAGFLLFSLLLSLALYLGSNKKLKTVLFGFCGLLNFSVLFFTASQAAWLTAGGGTLIVLIGLFFNKNFSKKKILIKIIAFSLLLYLAVSALLHVHFYLYPQKNNDFTRATSFMPTSSEARLIYWQNSLKIAKDYPLWGVGLGNFKTLYTHYFNQPWTYVSTPHNYFFYIITGAGFGATLTIFLFFLLTFYKIAKKYFRELTNPQLKPDKYLLFLGLTALIAASFAHSLLDFDLEIPSLAIIWWLTLGTLFYSFAGQIKIVGQNKIKKIALAVMTVAILILTFLIIMTDNLYLQSQKLSKKLNTADQRITLLSRAIKLMPLDANLYEALAESYWDAVLEHQGDRANNLAQSLAHAKKAADLDRLSAHRHWYFGKIYYFTQTNDKQWQNILEEFKLAVKFDFHDPTYYYSLADVYLMIGDKAKAKETIETILNYYGQDEINKIVFNQQIYENFGLKEKLDGLQKLKASIKE